MEKYLIKQILLEQEEEINEIFKGKIIKREVEKDLEKILTSNLIKVIMGVRRCGKSVLAHQLLKGKNYGYVNFDDERLVEVKAENLNDFLEVLKEIKPDFKYLLLDEIQNVDKWELFVNRLKRRGYNIFISGSNSKLLSRELATHLTGRQLSIELYPFSFREFLIYEDFAMDRDSFYITEKKAQIKRLLERYLEIGGMPEVFKIEAKKSYLRELFDKIIMRDIVARYNIKYVNDLKEIALYSISNFSSKITYHKIKNIFEIKSIHTVKNYIDYLQEAYLIFLLTPFSFKLKEQIKQARKVYCVDTGFINALVPKITFDKGRLVENLVFLELKRQGKEIYFYSKPAYEVDFLVREGLGIKQLMQVCFSISDEATRKREIKALLKASEELRCENLTIITWDEEGEEKSDSKIIKIVPLWKWLLTFNS